LVEDSRRIALPRIAKRRDEREKGIVPQVRLLIRDRVRRRNSIWGSRESLKRGAFCQVAALAATAAGRMNDARAHDAAVCPMPKSVLTAPIKDLMKFIVRSFSYVCRL